LQALFELELAGCNEVTEAGLWACLTPRIVSLTLTDCINVADEAVGAVAQLLPSLYEFSLQAYHVTDTALGYFSPKQSNSLSILRLHSCWELTNHGVVNIGECTLIFSPYLTGNTLYFRYAQHNTSPLQSPTG
jgi:F-box/leucine-rich repeat protein 16